MATKAEKTKAKQDAEAAVKAEHEAELEELRSQLQTSNQKLADANKTDGAKKGPIQKYPMRIFKKSADQEKRYLKAARKAIEAGRQTTVPNWYLTRIVKNAAEQKAAGAKWAEKPGPEPHLDDDDDD